LKFVFTRNFILLLALGLVLLSFAWVSRAMLYATIAYDLFLIILAVIDYLISEKASNFRIRRDAEDRFAMGADNTVTLKITNTSNRKVTFIIKDEYPSKMELSDPREVMLTVTPNRSRTWRYSLLPTARGNYDFGNTIVRFRSRMGFLWKQLVFTTARNVKVYPDIREA